MQATVQLQLQLSSHPPPYRGYQSVNLLECIPGMHAHPHSLLSLGHRRRHDGPHHEAGMLAGFCELAGGGCPEGEDGRGGRVVELEVYGVGVEVEETTAEVVDEGLKGLTVLLC